MPELVPAVPLTLSLIPEDCWMPCIVATLEETLACRHGWEWNPEVGWIHEFGRL